MTSMVFSRPRITVTKNTARLFVTRETNVKTIEHVKRDTQKSAEPLKEKDSPHMEKIVSTTNKLYIRK